jgi:hypothetical protein
MVRRRSHGVDIKPNMNENVEKSGEEDDDEGDSDDIDEDSSEDELLEFESNDDIASTVNESWDDSDEEMVDADAADDRDAWRRYLLAEPIAKQEAAEQEKFLPLDFLPSENENDQYQSKPAAYLLYAALI